MRDDVVVVFAAVVVVVVVVIISSFFLGEGMMSIVVRVVERSGLEMTMACCKLFTMDKFRRQRFFLFFLARIWRRQDVVFDMNIIFFEVA